ncbi:hypothetical protein HY419_00720 [candidate division WWE3 bacterium]|nr:hypothetical protein [candidate division WWE3 bacterium]
MSNEFYLEYSIETDNFTKNELRLMGLLKEAGKLIGKIYAQQIGEDGLSGNFYPTDATKEELEESFEFNPMVLNSYTVVKRDSAGKLFAIPYHEEYLKDLTAVSKLLLDASELSENESFKNYLKIASGALLSGGYEELERAWVAIDEGSRLHLLVGPLGSYSDRLLSLKKAYNFNLTFTSGDGSFNPSNYIEVIRNILPPFASKGRIDVPPKKIKIRVDDVAAIGGRNSVLPARSVNYPAPYPAGERLIREIGVKIVVYTNNIKIRDRNMLALFREFIHPEIQANFSDDCIMDNALRFVLAHEITEAVFQYPGSWERLKGMFNYVYELHSSIVGIKGCGLQVIKGVLTQKDLEAILYIMLVRTFSDYYIKKRTAQIEYYLLGYRVFYNYLMENGAIKIDGSWILTNPGRIYACVDRLANILMKFYSEASEDEASDFFDKYSSDYMYEQFSAKLSKYDF